MPAVSKAQQRFMYAKKPKLAKKFAKETSNFKTLPGKITDKQRQLNVLKKDLRSRK